MKKVSYLLILLIGLTLGNIVAVHASDIPQGFKQFGTYTTIERNWHYNCAVVYALWKSQGSKSEENIAYVEVDGVKRYLIAVAATFGVTGDYVTLEYDDGTKLPCLIMDEKNPNDGLGHFYYDIDGDGRQEHVGHMEGGSVNVIEWEITSPLNGSGDPSSWFSKVKGKKVKKITRGKETDSIIQAPLLNKVLNRKKGIKLEWSEYEDIDKYVIYRKTDTGIFQKLAEVDKDKTSYLDTTANKNGVKYQYKLTVVKDDTESGYRNIETIYRMVSPSLKAKKYNAGKTLVLSWKRNKQATGYNIVYSTDKYFEHSKSVIIKNNQKTSFRIDSKNAKQTIYVKIRSLKTVLNTTYVSCWSND